MHRKDRPFRCSFRGIPVPDELRPVKAFDLGALERQRFQELLPFPDPGQDLFIGFRVPLQHAFREFHDLRLFAVDRFPDEDLRHLIGKPGNEPGE